MEENNLSEDKSNLSRSFDRSHLFTNEMISSEQMIKYLLKYSKNILEEEHESSSKEVQSLTNEINQLLSKIEEGQIDVSKINIADIGNDIAQSLKTLFDNLAIIYFKYLKKRHFELLLSQTKLLTQKHVTQVVYNFMQKHFDSIKQGMILYKINFTSSGKLKRFYKINKLEENFEIKVKKTDKQISKKFNLIEEITRITYGVSTQNLINKLVNDPNNFGYKWMYFSIITKDRSIDLYVGKKNDKEDDEVEIQKNEEEKTENVNEENVSQSENSNVKIKDWFYGMKFFYTERKLVYKMMSCTKFILVRLKLKAVHKMEKKKKSMANNANKKDADEVLEQIVGELGVQKISFVKLFLFYKKHVDQM